MEGHAVSVIDRARTAYDPVNQAVRCPKSIEYEAFVRVTRALNQASEPSPTQTVKLAKAVHDNRRLWTMLAADVASGGNRLSQETRAGLFYLAEFTVAHSRKVLKREATVDALIDVNTAVMGGLRSSVRPT
ncbi:flagellar biosynthesis regulator FlaF [Rhodobacteraceae bacterium SC52]|nr:flagellar biosynthesis regulator FlaF [Rhodobacteraceae bacterium SC52]